ASTTTRGRHVPCRARPRHRRNQRRHLPPGCGLLEVSDRRATIWISALATITCVMVAGCEESRAPAAAHVAGAPAAEATTTADAASNPNAPPERPPAETETTATAPVREPVAAPVKAAVPAGVQDITFDTIKFPLEKTDQYERSKLTPAIEALHGHHVKLRGYI